MNELNLALVKQTLEHLFPGYILSRGYEYHQAGKVLGLQHANNHFSAQVSGSRGREYEVRGELPDRELVMICDCPYDGPCKHQAAVLYELRTLLSSSARTRGRSRRRKKNKTNQTKAPKRSTPKPGPLKFDGAHSGTYRRLPLEQASWADIVNRLGQPSFYHDEYQLTFAGRLSPQGEMRLWAVSRYSNPYAVGTEITLRQKDGTLWIKCETCNEKTSKLCTHQSQLLRLAGETLEGTGFLSPDFSLESLERIATQRVGIPIETFHKYYDLTFSPEGFGVRSQKNNIFGEEAIKKMQEILQDKTHQRKQKENLERQLTAGKIEKVAFLWMDGNYSYYRESMLRFVQGSGLKTKPGIRSSDRTITDRPIGFESAQMDLARQLYFYFQEEEPAQHFYEIQALLEQNVDTLNEVYQYISTSPSMRASDLYLVTFHPTPLEARFRVETADGLIAIRREVYAGEEAIAYSEVLFDNGIFCATATQAYLVPNPEFDRFMGLFPEGDTIYFPSTRLSELTALIQEFKKYFPTEVEEGLALEEKVLQEPEFQILLRELGDFITFEPRLQYGEYSANAFQEHIFFIDDHLWRVEESDRQFLVDFIKDAHPDFDRPVQVQDFVYLPITKMLDNYWFLHFSEACEAAGIELLGHQELSKFKYSKHKAATFTHVKSGIDWFEVDMGVSFGKEKVKMSDWLRALRNKESFVRLKDGTLGILPEEWLIQARKILAVADVEKGSLKISKYRFNIIEELFEELDDKAILQELAQKKKRLAELDTNKTYPIPDRLQAELRPYQEHGFAWLKFLEESGFGGILADDMGLGKTLQVLTILADQYNQPPSLVVVPRSLLFNWGAEIDKFCPSLAYVIHHGSGRAKSVEELLAYELVITTYGTAASDITLLKDVEFNYIVLDESQAIKNPASKRYKAMRLLRSRHKIAMTGTPIENNTFDLYAQLSFCSPGLLGTQKSFKEHFAVPIDNERDQAAANLLRKLIHPFVLRRTKEQVAKELPDKTETVIYCEMGNAQRKLYEQLKRKIREDIEAELEEKGLERSRFKMLDGLLRLRQMCNSPLLLNQTFKGQHAQSVKIDVLLEQLTEELDQHSALVFSQFVSFLALIRRELDQRGIPYAYLDGSTHNRQAEVERFMNREDVKIFLISLKAGNTGLNLTKADYVYILDPWWNPAVEAQAIDRTHRIGQDKNIFAYKLICKDSIEEKILKLQAQKKEISSDIIRTDEQAFKSLNKTELLELFR